MVEETVGGSGVGLPEAIESLRADLAAAWWDGMQRRVRFKVEPVELTVQVGLKQTGKGSAGVRWYILAMGGERSREVATMQTLKLRLTPFLFDDQGNVLPAGEQFICDDDGQDADGQPRERSHEPE